MHIRFLKLSRSIWSVTYDCAGAVQQAAGQDAGVLLRVLHLHLHQPLRHPDHRPPNVNLFHAILFWGKKNYKELLKVLYFSVFPNLHNTGVELFILLDYVFMKVFVSLF